MKEVDGYLSKKVQAFWPDAIVYRQLEGARPPAFGPAPALTYWIERPGVESLGIGKDFRSAKTAIEALRRQKETSDGT